MDGTRMSEELRDAESWEPPAVSQPLRRVRRRNLDVRRCIAQLRRRPPENALYAFCATGGLDCLDGKGPAAPLLIDSSGGSTARRPRADAAAAPCSC
jgi:hypothetical protein